MLAKEIGIDLDKMEGFGGDIPWEEYENDPICILLNHSDCDGQISAEQCLKVSPRLKELVSKWSKDDDYKWHRKRALELARGMLEAGKSGEPLLFE
jgi:hypothetical protein